MERLGPQVDNSPRLRPVRLAQQKKRKSVILDKSVSDSVSSLTKVSINQNTEEPLPVTLGLTLLGKSMWECKLILSTFLLRIFGAKL